MSKLCRISVVGLHLLLLTHITHSFVLLTANVDDLKKIARKFVSESLAERITDFIADATKTLAEEQNNSEENKRSQVSDENTVNDRLDDIIERSLLTKEETTVTPERVDTEKESHQEAKHTKATRSKTGKAAPKPLHGRSRYIERVKNDEPTETSIIKTRVENNVKNLKESTENIESCTLSTRKTKYQTNNKTKKRFKLLSAFDSNTNAATVTDKAKINKKLEHKPVKKSSGNPTKSMSRELIAVPESTSYDTDYEYGIEKVVNEFDQYDNRNKENTEKAANKYDYDTRRNKKTETEGTSAPLSEKGEYDNEINNIIPRDEKVVTEGFLAKEKNDNEDKWWEKKLTTHKKTDADLQVESKTWF